MRRQAALALATCLVGALLPSVEAFALTALVSRGAAPHQRASLLLRPYVAAEQPRAHGSWMPGPAASLRPATALRMGKTELVTYGDLWRDALNENSEGEGEFVVTDDTTADEDDFTYAMEEVSLLASEAVKPFKEAATGVASALWNKLSPSPDEEEVQRNLKAFAKCHSGAVMTPLGDDELASEVRYLGMFPDLVDALLEAQADDDSTNKNMGEDTPLALPEPFVEM